MKKKRFLCFISCVLVIANFVVASASAIGPMATSPNEHSGESDFINYCSTFFEEDGRFRAINSEGLDVSDQLQQLGLDAYQCCNWTQLKELFSVFDVSFLLEVSDAYPVTSIQIGNDLSSDEEYTVEDYQGFITEPERLYSAQEFVTLMEAYYSVNSDNEVSDAYVFQFGLSGIWGGIEPIYLQNVVVYSPIISGSEVTFSASFSAYKNSIYCGYFTHSFTADSSGDIIS